MYTISKRFGFCAAHQLTGLPEGHQCSRLHGHNYEVELTLMAEKLDEVGFIVDYGKLDHIKKWLDTNVEHKHLNDVFLFNPTAENLAKHFFTTFREMYPQILSVSVKETDKTRATYSDLPDITDLFNRFTELTSQLENEINKELGVRKPIL